MLWISVILLFVGFYLKIDGEKKENKTETRAAKACFWISGIVAAVALIILLSTIIALMSINL